MNEEVAIQEERLISTKPFGLKDKLGYLAGDFANSMTFILASSFLMVFYTEVLHIEGAAVGTLFVIARVMDAFTDVMMGRIVDKAKSVEGEGKFKPWIRRMAGPVALANFLMYQSSLVNAPMIVRIIYMYITYLLWGSIFYTAVNIPYGSMAGVMSPDPDERTSLSVFRATGATISSMLIGVVTPLFIFETDAIGNEVVRGGWVFPTVAGVFSVLAILFYYICHKWSTERVKVPEESEEEQVPFLQSFKQVLTNRSLVGIALASILLLMSMISMQQLINYLFPFYYGESSGISIMTFLMTGLSLVVGMPIANWLGKSIGKKEVGTLGMFAGSALFFLLYFMRPENMFIFIVIASFGFLSIGIFNGIVWGAVTDVVDDHDVQKDERADGVIYGVNSFARKVGQALAGGMGGYALTFIGYEPGATEQAAGVLDSLYDVTILIPAIGSLICGFVLLFLYPLSKKRVEENQRLLNERAVERE